jgi:alpha,alpha-trehalase
MAGSQGEELRMHTATTTSPDDVHCYPPIRDYAVIGDCHGAALVSRDGSVDWCCLGRFDADPVFCRLLDTTKGGFLSIRPTSGYTVFLFSSRS